VKRLLAVVVLGATLPACSSHQLDLGALSSPSDQIVWDAAQKAIQKKDWGSARQYLKRLIDAFPQSEHQPDARITLGDTYFNEAGTANYVLAVSTYREFLTLYPQHPRSDYAQFQAAESYFRQRNTPDRDQTATQQALEEYQRLLDIYPESKYLEQTRARIRECRQTLARSHHMVGYFYQRGRQAWRAATTRYETIINDYPDYDKLDEIYFRLAECLGAAGRYGEALPYLGRLEKEYPQSRFLAAVPKLRATFPPSATPAAPASSLPAGPSGNDKATSGASGKRPARPRPSADPAKVTPPSTPPPPQ
jgi:outer membrane protein assembly factor BamD